MKLLLPTIATVLLLLTACESTSEFDYEISDQFKPDTYRGFAILPIPHHEVGSHSWRVLGEGEGSLVFVQSKFESKGFEKVDYEEADFLVGLRTEVERIDPSSKDYNRVNGSDVVAPEPGLLSGTSGANPRIVGAGGNIPVQLEVSKRGRDVVTIRIEVFDKQSKLRVWTGLIQSKDSSSFRKESEVYRLIGELLESFPG